MIRCVAFLLLASTSAAFAQTPLWRDASATLPPKEAPGHSMNAKAADIDKDGDMDLVVAMEYRANRLLLGDGKGGFTDASSQLPRAARDSEEIALLDIDRDGDLDIAVANEDDLRQELYINDGKGRFRDASDRLVGRIKANAVVAFDYDRDGRMDLFFGGDKVSSLYRGNGRGGFTDVSATALPDSFGGTQDVAAGDIDGDNDVDLVLGNEDRNQIYVNDGKGRFGLADPAALPRPTPMEETRDVELFDVDADGDLDLFFANVQLWNPRANPQDRLLLNNGKGQFSDATATWLIASTESTLTALPLDLDGDGKLDLITTARATQLNGPVFDGAVRAWRNSGTRFDEMTSSWLPQGLETSGFDVIAADFDGDGKPDLFIAGRGGPDRLLLTKR
jgi:hypothetical protein